jgi:hypothetical protein
VVGEPTVDQGAREPLAPAHLDGLARQDHPHLDRRGGRDDEREDARRLPQAGRPARLEGIEEPAVPTRDDDVGGDAEEHAAGE